MPCYCPDDCNCRHAHRLNVCGCRAHEPATNLFGELEQPHEQPETHEQLGLLEVPPASTFRPQYGASPTATREQLAF